LQISDIVVGQEPNVSAKDYLLRWAKRTTNKYPGVNVVDFTKSWRDGLAFSAIIHRNRPDLVDWRSVKSKRASERMESAFYIAEREYGVTRLLDPEGGCWGMGGGVSDTVVKSVVAYRTVISRSINYSTHVLHGNGAFYLL
jgi:hypothetical protein